MKAQSKKIPRKIIFVTGTDTGVGKTVFTALLLLHYQAQGIKALAVKPFSSGTRADAELLHSLQKGQCTIDEINPFHFSKPVAPYVAARAEEKSFTPSDAVFTVKEKTLRTERLIVEGCGGVMTPLGKDYVIADFIAELECDEIVIIATNRLGAVNHTLLTCNKLQRISVAQPKIVLMSPAVCDASSGTNAKTIALFANSRVISLPFFDGNLSETSALKEFYKKNKKTLAQNFL